MNRLEGKTVFSGIAIGKISILQKADQSVKRYHVEDIEAELRRVEEAKQTAAEELQKLYEKALQEVGESGAAIFEVHQMMLQDEDYMDSVRNIIETQEVNAEITFQQCLRQWTMIICRRVRQISKIFQNVWFGCWQDTVRV